MLKTSLLTDLFALYLLLKNVILYRHVWTGMVTTIRPYAQSMDVYGRHSFACRLQLFVNLLDADYGCYALKVQTN